MIIYPVAGYTGSLLNNNLIVLSYADIRDEIKEDTPVNTVKTSDFINQLLWLKEHHYQVISLQEVLDSCLDKSKISEKSILLNFDYGHKSFYTKAFPVLKLFEYPAMLSIVGAWIETVPMDSIPADTTLTSDGNSPVSSNHQKLMSWNEINQVVKSGLVDIALNHSNLDSIYPADSPRPPQPVATSCYLDAGYNNGANYQDLLYKDLKNNFDLIKRHTKLLPRAIAWPCNNVLPFVARDLGIFITFGPDEVINDLCDAQSNYLRILITKNTGLDNLINALINPSFHSIRPSHASP